MEALTLAFQPTPTMVQLRHLTKSSQKQMATRVVTTQVAAMTPEAETQEAETPTHLQGVTMLVVETTPVVETLTHLAVETKVETPEGTPVGMPTHSLVVTKEATREPRVEMQVATLEPMVVTQVQRVVKTQLLANPQQTTP